MLMQPWIADVLNIVLSIVSIIVWPIWGHNLVFFNSVYFISSFVYTLILLSLIKGHVNDLTYSTTFLIVVLLSTYPLYYIPFRHVSDQVNGCHFSCIYITKKIFSFGGASKQNNVNGTVFIHNAKYLCLHYINKDIAFHKIQENLQPTNEYQYYNIRELISVIIRFNACIVLINKLWMPMLYSSHHY